MEFTVLEERWAATSLGRKRNIQIGAVLGLLGGALQGGAANLG